MCVEVYHIHVYVFDIIVNVYIIFVYIQMPGRL